MMRRALPAVLMLILVTARPAGSVLTDDEPTNDSMGTAAIQIVPTATVTTDGGKLTLVFGDIDYLGIGNLNPGDIVTVSTTPLDDATFSDPDTIIGLFNSGTTKKCEGDDSINNELSNPPGGLGSLCRFGIDSAGTWYVGVTGFSAVPFDGDHFESGKYQLLVTINLPEPGALLQLISGGAGLAWLHWRRNRKRRDGRSPKERDLSRDCCSSWTREYPGWNGSVGIFSAASTARSPGGRYRWRSSTVSLFLAALMLLVLAAPAGAIITDQEPANDTIPAPLVIFKTGPVTTTAGELVLVAGDIDFLGIAALSAGDIVTVSTTPLDDSAFEVPDTIVGLFDSTTTDPRSMILCRSDDVPNSDLDNCPGGDCPGWGSLCRFTILAPGDYYVGVTGFRPKFPAACDPAAPPGDPDECLSHPFDGGIGAIPCEEPGPTYTCGNYQVTIAVTMPEPGLLLQLASGVLALVVLGKRRRCANS